MSINIQKNKQLIRLLMIEKNNSFAIFKKIIVKNNDKLFNDLLKLF